MEEKSVPAGLSEPVKIGNTTAVNRFWANPLESNNGGAEGGPTDLTFERYRRLASGNWGVIEMESTTASDRIEERGYGRNALVLNASTRDGFRRLRECLREISPGTLVVIQLSPGRLGSGDDYAGIVSGDIERLFSGRPAPDFLGFARQSLADPLTPVKFMTGDYASLNLCRRCGGCSRLVAKQEPVHCTVY